MKVSKAGIVVLAVGVLLLIMAPVWKWGIGPTFIKLLDDINITSVYDGGLTLYVDPQSLQLLPEDMPVKIPLTITRKDTSVPEKSTGKVAVIKEEARAVGPGGKSFIDYSEYYAMDRKTAQNVAGNNSDMDRKGWRLMLPMGTEKKGYPMWDNDTRKSDESEFVRTEKISTPKNKDVEVYVFEAGGTDVCMEPPLGLPEKISGAQAKALAGNPGLPIADDQMVPITYEKTTEATFTVEPRTGTIVDLDNFEEFSVDATAVGMGKIKLATLKYKQTRESVGEVMDNISQYFGLLTLNSTWLPLIFLLAGLVLAVIGIILTPRRKTA